MFSQSPLVEATLRKTQLNITHRVDPYGSFLFISYVNLITESGLALKSMYYNGKGLLCTVSLVESCLDYTPFAVRNELEPDLMCPSIRARLSLISRTYT